MWHPPIITLWSLWPIKVIFVLLGTEDKVVDKSVPLQPFSLSPHLGESIHTYISLYVSLGSIRSRYRDKINYKMHFGIVP